MATHVKQLDMGIWWGIPWDAAHSCGALAVEWARAAVHGDGKGYHPRD